MTIDHGPFAAWRFAHEPSLRAAAEEALRCTPAWSEALAVRWGRQLRAWDDAWRSAWPEDPGDATCAAAWAGWLDGDPFGSRRWAEQHLLPEALTLVNAVVRAHGLPDHEQCRVRTELRDGLYFLLLHRDEGGLPPFADIAARVIETDGAPVEALARRVADWGPPTRCLARRRSWRATLRPVHADLERRLSEAPGFFAPLVEYHLWCRLLARPARAGTALLLRNLGRIRARLRATIAEDRRSLLGEVLALDRLASRTKAATRRFVWDWARRELSGGFSLGVIGRVTPRCVAIPATEVAPLPRPPLRTWVLLVLLRGRAAHLRRWVSDGTTGDGDSTWGRLLAESLPRSLRPPAGGRNHRDHRRLRQALARDLEGLLGELMPTLAALAAIPDGPRPGDAVRAVLAPGWDPEVPLPERGYRAMTIHVRHLLEEL